MFGQETKHAGIPKKSYITMANISTLNAVIHIKLVWTDNPTDDTKRIHDDQ